MSFYYCLPVVEQCLEKCLNSYQYLADSRITVILFLELVIKMTNKERNYQKEISTKCYLGTTEKCGPFKKIGDHKLCTTKDLIFATKNHLVNLNLLHGYDDGSEITEKE